jgi:uncharacterized protein YdaT
VPDVHVVHRGDQWACEISGNIQSTHDTQEEAIKQGQHLAEEQNTELIVHSEEGNIRKEDTPG